MKLYVCWGTWTAAPRPGGHPCGQAYKALKEAGHDPQVVRTHGWAALGPLGTATPGRREVKELSGTSWVPTLVLDDGTVINDSKKIRAWARENPAATV